MTKKRKFIPTILVTSDDLVVFDEEGNEHRPHEGEWVRFRKSVPMAVMRIMTEAATVRDVDAEVNDDDQVSRYAGLIDHLVDILARQITDWNWTDEDYRRLPKPRAGKEQFRDTLYSLEDYEWAWLQAHMGDGSKLEKNS